VADPTGFLTTPRRTRPRRPVDVRIRDWREVYEELTHDELRAQAGRCMDCGVAFCHAGCPLGNLIPEWNDLVRRGDGQEASERLHATNNFPEFTGRLCPAPCEAACVLGIADDPVTIEQVELDIAERAWSNGWVTPTVPGAATGRGVAVVGSGPAGLAAAQQLARAGHAVTVFERADRPGGLLRYGIPEFKLPKPVLDRRLAQLVAEGVRIEVGVEAGGPRLPAARLRAEFDAVVLAGGAAAPRDLPVPGRCLDGVLFAMEYLTAANRAGSRGRDGDVARSAAGRQVVIIGGGDTGADCLGTAHRQGALSVTQLEILPEPPPARSPSTPWPLWPLMLRTSSAHEEGGVRRFAVRTSAFLEGPAGRVGGVAVESVRPVPDGGFEPVPGTGRVLPADLVLLALGFAGPERSRLLDGLGVGFDARGCVARDASWQTTAPGVFVAGDMGRGQSLVVWAIAEGRSVAAAVDRWLTGSTTLPAPIGPAERALA
jgi:glutamate synthase (NADPH/NADH) small chain